MSNIKDNLLQLIGKTPLVRLSNIYKDEYGRRRSEEEHHDAGGSLPVPHRSDHRLPRFLRLSDLRYR